MSSQQIQDWLADKNYRPLLRFVLDSTLNILRDKLRVIPELAVLALRIDDMAMVELCCHHKVIDYPDFIQIVQVINVRHTSFSILKTRLYSQLTELHSLYWENRRQWGRLTMTPNSCQNICHSIGRVLTITSRQIKVSPMSYLKQQRKTQNKP